MKSKEQFETIVKIAKRADEMGLLLFDRMSLIMDLECVNLKYDELLQADNFNFSHDICGIQNNLNRQAKQLGNEFLPRYAM